MWWYMNVMKQPPGFSETDINGNRFLIVLMTNEKFQCLRTTQNTDPNITRLQ